MDPTTAFDYDQSPSTTYTTNSYQDTMLFTTTDPIELSYPSISTEAKINNKRRSQVKNACVNCQKACKKCDEGRPCQRCIKLGITDTCINSPRKERKKGFKRGPYKKKTPQPNQHAVPKKVCKTQKNPSVCSAIKTKARTVSNASSLSYSPSLSDWPLDYSPSFSGLPIAQDITTLPEYSTQITTSPYRNTANLAEQSFYDFYNNINSSTGNNISNSTNSNSRYSVGYHPKQQEPIITECYDPCVPVIDYSSLTIQQEFLLTANQPSDLSYYTEDYTVCRKPLATSQLVPKLENYNQNGITPPAYDAMTNQLVFNDGYLNSKYCQNQNNFLYNQWPKDQILLDQQNIYATYDNQFF